MSRVLIAGASGFLGRHIAAHLEGRGHDVGRLVRREVRVRGETPWDPARGALDPALLRGWDAVVNLCGRGIATRWNVAVKREIRESRVASTGLLSGAMAQAQEGPRVLVSASAAGFYGDRGDEELHEGSGAGEGFLSSLCRDWEAAAQPASAAGVRVVLPRLGMVLSPEGGALPKMLPAFRLGVGGPWGSGRQWVSWVALDDALRALEFALTCAGLSGPVNVVAPEPVRAGDFARALARAVGRPCVARVPAEALELVLGEMARETLLSSARVVPRALGQAGFEFAHPEVTAGLAEMLKP